ncbi:MAG: type III polyketide synthase [Pirellulales bacterium]
MHIQVHGIGTAVPAGMITQRDAARLALAMCPHGAGLHSALPSLYERTTIRTRHSVLVDSSSNGRPATQSFYPRAHAEDDRGPTTARRMQRYESTAAELAAEAAAAALDDCSATAEEIAHLVTVSCSGFSAPGVDIGLIERLGLRRDVSRTHVGFMGCHGAMNGLRVAAALAKSSPRHKVLLCCVEICSIHHQYPQQFDQMVANALFADGAAAAVLSAGKQTADDWQLLEQRSLVLRDSADAMSWRIRDHGFEMSLSAGVPGLIRESLRGWIDEWLFECGLSIDEIRGWIVHPGGPQILASCQEALELPPDALAESYDVLANYGNMSSPTVLFILDRMRRAAGKVPCVTLAFGPGLTIEGALFC